MHACSWPFLHPVNIEEVADYYEIIKRPMGQCNISARFAPLT